MATKVISVGDRGIAAGAPPTSLISAAAPPVPMNFSLSCVCATPPVPPPVAAIVYSVSDFKILGFLQSIQNIAMVGASLLASFILMLMCIRYLWRCISRRLWLFPCYPARSISLNAGTLALLAASLSFPKYYYRFFGVYIEADVWYMSYVANMGSSLACVLIGACMPSVATTNRSHMWSNVAGTVLLLLAIIFNDLYMYDDQRNFSDDLFFSYLQYNIVGDQLADLLIYLNGELSIQAVSAGGRAACLMLVALVLITQALTWDAMMPDVAACVSARLQQLENINNEANLYHKLQTKLYVTSTENRAGNSGVGEQMVWTWEALELKTYAKLMMALTSNPQNIASRSTPSSTTLLLALASIVTAASQLLLAILILSMPAYYIYLLVFSCVPVSVLLFGCICMIRCLRIACMDDQPLTSHLFHDTHPFYRRQKVTNFWQLIIQLLRADPHRSLLIFKPTSVWQQVTYVLKLVLYSFITCIMFFFIIPIHLLTIACVRLTHAVFILLVWIIFRLPLRMFIRLLIMVPNLSKCRGKLCLTDQSMPSTPAPVNHSPDPSLLIDAFLCAGVIALPGENQGTVQKLFQGSAKHIIRQQIKKAKTKSTKALTTLLKLSTSQAYTSRNCVFLEVLDHRGTPDHEGLQQMGPHGSDHYGWSLTIVCLLEVMNKVECEAFGSSETCMAAMKAWKQAMEMVKVVEEMPGNIPVQLCSKETYSKLIETTWFSLLNHTTRRSSNIKTKLGKVQFIEAKGPVQVLDDMLECARRQLQGQEADAFPWTAEEVKAYTVHTVCKNLQRWCTNYISSSSSATRGDNHQYTRSLDHDQLQYWKGESECLIEHIKLVIAEVLAGCLYGLPVALETRTNRAVRSGHIAQIKKAILLMHQAHNMWQELQWPLHSSTVLISPPANSYFAAQFTACGHLQVGRTYSDCSSNISTTSKSKCAPRRTHSHS